MYRYKVFKKKKYALYPTIGFFTVHGQYGHKGHLPFLDFLLLNVMEFLWKSDVVYAFPISNDLLIETWAL